VKCKNEFITSIQKAVMNSFRVGTYKCVKKARVENKVNNTRIKMNLRSHKGSAVVKLGFGDLLFIFRVFVVYLLEF
jgi:hypothetical protein